jgi:ribosomal protein L37AE/L43A
MTKRTCPKCGKSWYSADDLSVWICENCGAEIGPDRNEPAK